MEAYGDFPLRDGKVPPTYHPDEIDNWIGRFPS